MQYYFTAIVVMMCQVHASNYELRRFAGSLFILSSERPSWRCPGIPPVDTKEFVYWTNFGMIQRGNARIASGKIITKHNTNSMGASSTSVL